MTKNQTECVYFFHQGGNNMVKIGMTRKSDISSRFQHFKTYSPYGGKVLGIIKTDNALKVEREIHKELANRRLKGEFFMVSEEECKSIIERYNTEETTDVISHFMIWLSQNESSIDDLNSILKRVTNKTSDTEEAKVSYHQLINKYFDYENRTGYLTATEIKNIIEQYEGISITSMKVFGSNLIDIFGKSRAKKINGVPLYRYYVGIKI